MASDAKVAHLQRLQRVEGILYVSGATTLTIQQTNVRSDTTSTGHSITLPDCQKCAGFEFLIQNNSGNSTTVVPTGVAPDGNQVIAVDEGYVVMKSYGYMWVPIAKKLS